MQQLNLYIVSKAKLRNNISMERKYFLSLKELEDTILWTFLLIRKRLSISKTNDTSSTEN